MEGLVLVAVAVVLPAWPRRIVAAVAGILFGLLTLVKILNMTFYEEIGRSFNPVFGWVDIGPAIGVVRDTIGPTRTTIALAALCARSHPARRRNHRSNDSRHHRGRPASPRRGSRRLAALTAVWALFAGLSLQLVPGSPVASTSAAGLAVAQVRDTQAALRDQRRFEKVLHGSDPEASVPASDLLTGLRGKDVIIDFVESYGQVAVQGSELLSWRRRRPAPEHRLAGPGRLVHAERLAHVPGFGGVSQLAHSTLLSGLWVNTEQRYAELVGSRPVHPQRRLRQGRLAHRERQPRGRPRLAARRVLLPLRQALRPVQRRLPRPSLQLRLHARPVHPGRASAERTRPRPQARDGRDRHGLLAHALGPVADHGALEQGRQRLDIRPHARAERIPDHGLAQRQHRAPVLRPVDPVLAAGPHLMGHRTP